MGFGDFLYGVADTAMQTVGGGTFLHGARKWAFGGSDPFSLGDNIRGGKDLLELDKKAGEGIQAAGGALLKGVDRVIGQEGAVGKSLQDPKSTGKNLLDLDYQIGQGLQSGVKGVATGANWVREHPVETYKVANAVSKEIIMSQLTPANIALTVATGGMSLVGAGAKGGSAALSTLRAGKGTAAAARSGLAVAKGARTADELAAGLSAGSKFFSGPTKYARAAAEGTEVESGLGGSLGKLGQARANKIGDIREGLGMGRLSRFQEGRAYYGEQIAERFPGAVGENAARVVANSPGAPMTGGRFAELTYEAKSGVALAQDANKLKAYGPALDFASDPKGAALKYGEKAVTSHKDEIVDYAATQAKKQGFDNLGDMAKNKVVNKVKDSLMDDEDSTYDSTESTVQRPQAQVTPGMGNWSAGDSGGFVSPRKSRSRGAVTTTVASPLSGDVGPSHWYGGQNNYGAGRGFASKPFGTTPWQKDPAYS